MKNIFAIIIVISSLIILLMKKISLRKAWKKTTAEVIETKKILKNKKGQILYKYKVDKSDYSGSELRDLDESFDKISEKNNKITIYYNVNNPEISVRNIPKITNEDYLLGGIGIVGGLYLYLYSCENCVCEVNYTKDNLPQVKLSNV